MNINSILKKEGIQIKSTLTKIQIEKIAEIIANQICEAFPEHNLNFETIFSTLSNLDMYIAEINNDAIAKYYYKNNSIYFNSKINWEHIDTLVIHECIHALQEIKNHKGKLLRLGLYNLTTGKGQGINEAAVQLMASASTKAVVDTVKYYNMDFHTESPLYYPIETALMKQILYFTGSYPLFHSTLFSNNVFKNTFIAKTSQKTYNTIEYNFDLLIYYEDLLSITYSELETLSSELNTKKINKLNTRIEAIKSTILNITISTQNLIIESCFNSEFNHIKDQSSLNKFRERLYNFKDIIINSENNTFYNSFYCEMMNKLDEKSELIKKYGVLTYLNDLQTDLLDIQKETFGFSFFRNLFHKLKLLFEEAIRQKDV